MTSAIAQLPADAYGVVIEGSGTPVAVVTAKDLKAAKVKGSKTLKQAIGTLPVPLITGSRLGMHTLVRAAARQSLIKGSVTLLARATVVLDKAGEIPGWRTWNIQVQKGPGWTALDLNKEYSVSVSEFLFNCRDGYVFRNAVTSYIPPGPDLRKLVLDSFNRARPAKGVNTPEEGVFEAPPYSRGINFAKVN